MNILQRIKLIMSDIWKFLEPFVRLFMGRMGLILAELAMQTVTEVAASYKDADGETKRKAAFRKLKDQLIERGISVGSSVINSAIEAAVQKLKAEQK